MRVVLDTCAFIWLCSDPDQFSARVATMFRQEDPDLFISDASIFEISVKHSIGKLKLPQSPRVWIEKQCAIWNIQPIPLSHEVLYSSAELPLHHRDPFDRLIIAAALNEKMPIITTDKMIHSYDVEVIW